MKNILIVEDDQTVVRDMRKEIEKRPGLTASFAATVEEAQRLLLNKSVIFDSISVDAQFPRRPGEPKSAEPPAGIALLYVIDTLEHLQRARIAFYSHNKRSLKLAERMTVHNFPVISLNKSEVPISEWLDACLPA